MKSRIAGIIFAVGFLISGCSPTQRFLGSLPIELRTTNGIEKFQKKIDYSNPKHWLAFPDSIAKPVDVIYLYPTAYVKGPDNEPDLCDIDNEIMIKYAENDYRIQATVFDESCNVFAPFYRQFDVTAMGDMNEASFERHMQYLAGQDVAGALDYYFKNENKGRPFILAGHSQGSAVIIQLLKDYFNSRSELQERMIAAYPIGYSITREDMAAIPFLHFAEGEDDVNVVVTWNTEGPGNANQKSIVVKEGELVINPLTWTCDTTYASIDWNIGTLSTQTLQIEPGATDAQISYPRGVVVVTSPGVEKYRLKNKLLTQYLGTDSYHGADYTLFYANLKKNVADRISAYQNRISDK